MTTKTSVDAARVELLLNELRLPGIKVMWPSSPSNSTRKASRRLASWRQRHTESRPDQRRFLLSCLRRLSWG